MESPVPIEAEEVLQFWLSETPMERRFVRDKALDAAIRERFGALHARLAEKVPQEWRDRPRGLLAAVIVLDQFSRNLYRDDPRAFAQDEAARALMREALDKEIGRAYVCTSVTNAHLVCRLLLEHKNNH